MIDFMKTFDIYLNDTCLDKSVFPFSINFSTGVVEFIVYNTPKNLKAYLIAMNKSDNKISFLGTQDIKLVFNTCKLEGDAVLEGRDGKMLKCKFKGLYSKKGKTKKEKE